MVAPVSGPHQLTYQLNGPVTSLGYTPKWVTVQRTWYKQKKPYNLPLTFKYDDRRVLSRTGGDPTSYMSTNDVIYWTDATASNGAYNRARERLVDKIGAAASLSVTLAERKQALEMISKRSLQLFRFVNALRKGRFSEAADQLGMELIAKRKRRVTKAKIVKIRFTRNPMLNKRLPPVYESRLKKGAKNFANNYLEFHFGWSPLVTDIGNAVEVLQSVWPPMNVTASAKQLKKWRTATSYGYNDYSCTASWRLQTKVEVTNPNYNLANQLGFTNPALVAWELVPFSFVLDWFVNVGDFLSSFTDLSGYSLKDSQRTLFSVTEQTNKPLINYTNHPYRATVGVMRFVYVERIVGAFPNTILRVRDPWSLSPRRGLAAISLLLQKMR